MTEVDASIQPAIIRSSEWDLADLPANDIVSNMSVSAAPQVNRAFDYNATREILADHAKEFLDSLKVPISVGEAIEKNITKEIILLLNGTGIQIESFLDFSPCTSIHPDILLEILLGMSLGNIPVRDSSHSKPFTEAALDCIHVTFFFDVIFRRHGGYNRNNTSDYPLYFVIDNVFHQLKVKPDVELGVVIPEFGTMGRFVLEHKKDDNSKASHGHDRGKCLWMSRRSFLVREVFPLFI